MSTSALLPPMSGPMSIVPAPRTFRLDESAWSVKTPASEKTLARPSVPVTLTSTRKPL